MNSSGALNNVSAIDTEPGNLDGSVSYCDEFDHENVPYVYLFYSMYLYPGAPVYYSQPTGLR